MPATPDPDLALRVAKEIADIYGQAVDDVLRVVARRLAAGIDRPGWAERKLVEQVRLRNEARDIVDRLTTLGPDAIRGAVEAGWLAGVGEAAADLEVTTGFVGTNTRAVEALARETVERVQSTHLQLLRSVDDAYRAVIAEASAPGVVTGTVTRRVAAQRALDRFADRGITGFVDQAGRRWQLETYAEMATRAAAGRAQVAGALDRYQAAGKDLVVVSDAPQECRLCRPWEGRVLSISGATPDYPTVASATAAGLHHANCRHSLTLFTPGLTRRPTRTADPEGDAARQEQRRLERGVRHWRGREAVAITPQAQRLAKAKVRDWRAALDRHVEAHDLKRLRHRETLGAR